MIPWTNTSGSAHVPHSLLSQRKKVTVTIPVEKTTTIGQLKSTFIEAVAGQDEINEKIAGGGELGAESIKLWKYSSDDDGNEKWIALGSDSATVDRAGLDQSHVVGVSFLENGECAHLHSQVDTFSDRTFDMHRV